MAPYREKDQYYVLFDQLTQAHSDKMRAEVIGYTVQGKPIKVYKIGNPNGGKVAFDAQIHGQSFPASEILLLYAQWLFSNDVIARSILEKCYMLIVPVLNIDGYDRKNVNGVDLNRNFPWQWENGSSDPTSWEYRGPSPASEPETKAMINLFQTEKPNMYVNHHCWGGPYMAVHYVNLEQKSVGDSVYNQYKTLAQQIGVDVYTSYRPVDARVGSTSLGYAASTAASLGSCAWAWEILISGTHTATTPPPLTELQTYWFPRWLPFAITLSQAYTPPPPPCFIATAAYGSPLAAELNALRGFRDNFMASTKSGRLLIKSYYEMSPPIAKVIAKHERLRKTTRMVLAPTINMLKRKRQDGDVNPTKTINV